MNFSWGWFVGGLTALVVWFLVGAVWGARWATGVYYRDALNCDPALVVPLVALCLLVVSCFNDNPKKRRRVSK